MRNAGPVTILGIDPGLLHTGWGVVRAEGNRLSFVAAGTIDPSAGLPMAARLAALAAGLGEVIARHRPDEAAVEESFVNGNARAALKLGQARGVALLCPAQAGIPVGEYAANLIKKSVTGYGHADKKQIQAMIGILLPGADAGMAADAADALAVAICHAHHRGAERLRGAS
ncbi:MAG: crossover junction endodeoxyribonuclease RuvC [Alphaproteobacteria bacterium]